MVSSQIFRSAIFFLLFLLSTTASAFCTRTSSWTEDVLLHDGRLIKISREVCSTFQLFYGDGGSPGMFGSWPDKHWLKFEHPDTHETIKWQGEQYFDPALLDFVDGVPYLVVFGRPDKNTEKIYGCPELPYIYLKYEKKGLWGKWISVPVEQAPVVLRDANLSQDDVSVDDDKHASLHAVQWNIEKVEGSSGGEFQAKIPRSYEDWYSVNNNLNRKERHRNDCRPPLVRPSPSPKFEAARQKINGAGLEADLVTATLLSTATTPETITAKAFSKSKGLWTGHGYLSSRCDGIVRTIEPIREYFDNGGWHLTGSQLVLNSREEIPFQQTSLSKYQAPTIPQLVTCGDNTIYAASPGNKDNLLVYRFAYSGRLIDALNIALPDVSKIATGKERMGIWELIPMEGHLSIVLADYSYTSTANLGGTINKKQTYAVNLPKFRKSEQISANSKTTSQATPQTSVTSFRDCPSCPEMIAIPGKNYAIGKYEVTQAEWKSIMGKDNLEVRHNLKGDNKPAIWLQWQSTQEFISKLNQITGKNYRLPSEPEWEFACLGGSEAKYCGGNDIDAVAWHKGNSRFQLRPVGQKQPNGYGLYDMSGNVWEWVDDCWKNNCDLRIVRGGSFNYIPLSIPNAYLYGKTSAAEDIGFRLVRSLQ